MVDSNLLVVFSFLQIFGNYPVFRKLNFKSIEEWLESSSTTGGNFQHCLHLLLGKQPQHKSFLTKLLEFCNYYLGNGSFRARQLHNCPSSLKLQILLGLLERQLVVNKQLKKFLNCSSDRLRVRPVGEDKHGNFYWIFLDRAMEVRIFKLHISHSDEEEWTQVAKNKESFEQLLASLEEEATVENVEDFVHKIGASEQNTIPTSCTTTSEGDNSILDNKGMQLTKNEDLTIQQETNALLHQAFDCGNCKEKVLTPSIWNLSSHLILQSDSPVGLCSICKHKMLVNNLEERFLIYSESLDRMEVSSTNNHPTPNDILDNEKMTTPDEVTTSSVIKDSVENKQPETLSTSSLQENNITETFTTPPPCKITSKALLLDDVPSSPSDFEDNEIKDPSFEFDLSEPTDEDDNDIEEYLHPGRKKDKNKSNPLWHKNKFHPMKQSTPNKVKNYSNRTRKNNRHSSSLLLEDGSKKPSRQRTNVTLLKKSFQISKSDINYRSFSASKPTSLNTPQPKASHNFISQSQHTVPHGRNHIHGATDQIPLKAHNINGTVSKIGNSTSFVGKLAHSKSFSFTSSCLEKPINPSTNRHLRRHFSDCSYSKQAEIDELDNLKSTEKFPIPSKEDDIDEDKEIGAEDWAWEDYNETQNYEDCDYYDYGLEDDQFENEYYTPTDDNFVSNEDDDNYEFHESFAEDTFDKNEDVIHVINSDAEKDYDDNDNEMFMQEGPEMYCNNEYNYDGMDVNAYDIDGCDEDPNNLTEVDGGGAYNYCRSKGHQGQDTYSIESHLWEQTPEDDCFVVEVIE